MVVSADANPYVIEGRKVWGRHRDALGAAKRLVGTQSPIEAQIRLLCRFAAADSLERHMPQRRATDSSKEGP
jgi:hypothetical protein